MARFTLEQMRTFLAVVRLGGVRRAAIAQNLTQPAVTTRIKSLEGALGCDLFDRTGGGLRLTKRGELLLAHAESFEHLVERVVRDVADPAGVEGRLRLGASETVAQCWLPELVSRLHDAYPKLEIEVNVDVSTDLRAALLGREIDLAILLGPISEYTVENIALPGFDLAWYCAAARDPAEMAGAYLTLPVMSYARNTRPFQELKEMLMERGGPDVALFPSSSLSACFRLVEADMGVAVLPRALGADHVRAGRIREFDPGWVPQPLEFTASFLRAPKSHLNQTAGAMAQEVARAYARRADA